MVENEEENVGPTGADALFTRHSINEIVEIRSKIVSDIQKKNVELREMVGERYRDLIDAADTIQHMKKVADELPGKLRILPAKCEMLKTKKLEVVSRDRAIFSDHAQTKLIFDICAKLATMMERRELISCSALISLAQLALRNHKLADIMRNSTQNSLRNSSRVLGKECLAAMRDPICDSVTLNEVLCTLSVLEGAPCTKLIDMFFNERYNYLKELLESHSNATKEKLQKCAKYLISTLNLCKSFQGDHPSFVDYFNDHAVCKEGIVSLIQDPLSLSAYFLPDNLTKFKCILPESVSSAKGELLDERIAKFIEDTKNLFRDSLQKELQCHTDTQSISRANDYLLQVLEENKLEIDLKQKSLNIYDCYFKDAIINRVAVIFEEIINSATEQLLNSVHASFNQAATTKLSSVGTLVQEFDSKVQTALEQLEKFEPYSGSKGGNSREILCDLSSTCSSHNLARVTAFISQCVSSGVRCANFLAILSQVASNLALNCAYLAKVHTNNWNKQCEKLLESRDLAALTAVTVIIEDSAQAFEKDLSIEAQDILVRYCSPWSEIELEAGEDEEGGKATVSLPQQVLSPLSTLLFNICIKIKQILDCCISRKVMAQANQKLVKLVENVYSKIVSNSENLPSSLKQHLAIQLIFDMEYLGELLNEDVVELSNELISLIDPVDYQILHGHLEDNVTVLAIQTQMLLGLLCPKITTNSAKTKKASAEHNVASLTEPTIPRFSLLPVSVPQIRR